MVADLNAKALVRVIPTDGGFLVDVAVYKELEDLSPPEHATTGAVTASAWYRKSLVENHSLSLAFSLRLDGFFICRHGFFFGHLAVRNGLLELLSQLFKA